LTVNRDSLIGEEREGELFLGIRGYEVRVIKRRLRESLATSTRVLD